MFSPKWGDYIKYFSSLIGDNFDYSKLICHKIPERTFKIKGHYFPVCSRCTGVYIGAFSYFIYAYLFYVDYTLLLIFSGFLMSIPAIIDGLTQLMGLRESNNFLRLLTGIMGGLGAAILIKFLKLLIITNWGV